MSNASLTPVLAPLQSEYPGVSSEMGSTQGKFGIAAHDKPSDTERRGETVGVQNRSYLTTRHDGCISSHFQLNISDLTSNMVETDCADIVRYSPCPLGIIKRPDWDNYSCIQIPGYALQLRVANVCTVG